jgi:hypothetical protein
MHPFHAEDGSKQAEEHSVSIDATAERLIADCGAEAYEQCRAAARYGLSIGNLEIALSMAATAARVVVLQRLPPLESPKEET